MVAPTKKKTAVKKKPVLKKSKKVNLWLIGIGALLVAAVGAFVVTMSFAGRWPQHGCGVTVIDKHHDAPPTLRQGSRGACVKVLQTGLKNAGFMRKSAPTDGVFGTNTANSVLLMQTYYNLSSKDKVMGKCSWYALYAANRIKGMDDKTQVRYGVALQGPGCLK